MDDEKKTESVPKLPDGLSTDFVQIIDKLKQVHITFTVKSLVFVGLFSWFLQTAAIHGGVLNSRFQTLQAIIYGDIVFCWFLTFVV
jgi:hypothetical protein